MKDTGAAVIEGIRGPIIFLYAILSLIPWRAG